MIKHDQPVLEDIPPSRKPSADEVHKAADEYIVILRNLVKIWEPANSNHEQIRLGLLVKITKTYHTINCLIDPSDIQTLSIVMRTLYELVLTYAYLVINKNDSSRLYNEFQETALGRLHRIKANVTKTQKHYKIRQSTKDTIDSIDKILSLEAYDSISARHDIPKSWAFNISYEYMAKKLGGLLRQYYLSFYEYTSAISHPNWIDIKYDCLIPNQDGSMRVNWYRKPVDSPILIATCIVYIAIRVTATYNINNSISSKESMINTLNRVSEIHHNLHN